MTRKLLYIDLDNVLVDFPSGIEQLDTLTRQAFDGRLDEVPNIFSLMKPMPDAIDSFNELAEVFDTYILSTSPWENPSAWSDKLNWVKAHLGPKAYKRLILSHHKNLNRGDFLVDDRDKNGVDKFEGEVILFGSEQFPDWKVTKEYLFSRV